MQLVAAQAAEPLRNFVVMRLGPQLYALPIEPVVQLIEMVTITPLPQAHRAVTGVITVRGMTVPVIDLGRVLGMSETRRDLHTPIVLVQVDERTVGLVVDELLDVRVTPASQVVFPENILPDGLGTPPLVEGLIHDHERTVLLLDMAQLFRPLPGGGLAVQTLVPLPDAGGQATPAGRPPVAAELK
jgi:purine-binding chemotaxis protein CheW